MPRYCDACLTFITSRDSLTWNHTPVVVANGHTRDRSVHPHLRCGIPEVRPVQTFMTFAAPSVKGFCAAVVLRIWVVAGSYGVIAGRQSKRLYRLFALPQQLALKTDFTPVLRYGNRLSSVHAPRSPKSSDGGAALEIFHSSSFFHRPSIRFFVASSITISLGHGRAKPSEAHFRVASIPIFEP